jgi:mono/diheme cytochrome c family protein
MSLARVQPLLAAIAVSVVLGHGAAAAPSAENGKSEFVRHGCWQCHGFEGQGSAETSGGKVIANTTLPLEAFSAYVRDPAGAMPPYHAEVLSDSELADIYAYLQSRPKPEPAKDIPLLQDLRAR